MSSEVERAAKLVNDLKKNFDRRLGNLAQEMALAGMQTLISDFGFTQEQAMQWLDKMLAKANANRGDL